MPLIPGSMAAYPTVQRATYWKKRLLDRFRTQTNVRAAPVANVSFGTQYRYSVPLSVRLDTAGR